MGVSNIKDSFCFQVLKDEEQRRDYDYMLDNPGQ